MLKLRRGFTAELFVAKQTDGVFQAEEMAMCCDPVFEPKHLLQPARYEGSGVTINLIENDDDLIFLSGFFGDTNELRLIQRDGTIVQQWPLSFADIFTDMSFLPSPPASDWNVGTHGALALPDGSVVFNFDYSGTAKLDRAGQVVWTINDFTHHSIERAESGGFWIPGQRTVGEIPHFSQSPFPPFQAPFVESTLMRVSEEGEVIEEISVPQLFYDNGLEALLSSKASIYKPSPHDAWNREIVHLNNISELSSELADDFPLFETGDLILSMRDLNLLMVIDPKTKAVKWWHVGPWLRQHDPEFIAGGKINVFNNNTYIRVAFGEEGRTTKLTSLDLPRVSNIIEIDPVKNVSTIRYGSRIDQEMFSVTRGKIDPTEHDGLIVTEFDGGRVFEIDANGTIVWEYINRYDDDEVAEITEARIYPRSYFEVKEWQTLP